MISVPSSYVRSPTWVPKLGAALPENPPTVITTRRDSVPPRPSFAVTTASSSVAARAAMPTNCSLVPPVSITGDGSPPIVPRHTAAGGDCTATDMLNASPSGSQK